LTQTTASRDEQLRLTLELVQRTYVHVVDVSAQRIRKLRADSELPHLGCVESELAEDPSVDIALAKQARELVDQLAMAHRLAKEGSFGACPECRENLTEARLAAIRDAIDKEAPFSWRCCQCQRKIETEREQDLLVTTPRHRKQLRPTTQL